MTIRRGRRVASAAGAAALVVMILAVWLGWPYLVFWYRFESLGANVKGLREYRHRQTGIVMVLLPGGTFWMGAQKTNPKGRNYDPVAGDNEAPVHEVTLNAFLMGKYEVTQAQWKKVMGTNPSCFRGDELPVETVRWTDVQEFEAKTGLALPMEAQWEYACRGGTTTTYAGKIEDLSWFSENSGGAPHPVGTKAPNGFGLHDLHGNIWEWCEDVWDGPSYGKPEGVGPDEISILADNRVLRGGSWRHVADNGSSAIRYDGPSSGCDSFVGFRVATTAP